MVWSEVLHGARGGNKKGGSVIARTTNAQARRESEVRVTSGTVRGAARSSDSENIERGREGDRKSVRAQDRGHSGSAGRQWQAVGRERSMKRGGMRARVALSLAKL